MENTNTEKTPPPYTAPAQSQPAVATTPAKTGSAMPRWVPVAILIVIIAGIGYLIWNNEQSKKKNAPVNDTGQTAQQTGPDTTHVMRPVIPDNHIEAKDFAGVWRAYETNSEEAKIGDPKDDLFIEVHNGLIDIYPRSEKDEEDRGEEISCDEIVGNTITCLAKERGHESTSASIKMEMAPSRNEMTVTIIPSGGTVTRIIKTRRLNEGLE